MKNNCVIYYSRTDKTRAAAEAVAEKMDADIFEIKDLKSRSGILGFISGIIDVKKAGSQRSLLRPLICQTMSLSLWVLPAGE